MCRRCYCCVKMQGKGFCRLGRGLEGEGRRCPEGREVEGEFRVVVVVVVDFAASLVGMEEDYCSVMEARVAGRNAVVVVGRNVLVEVVENRSLHVQCLGPVDLCPKLLLCCLCSADHLHTRLRFAGWVQHPIRDRDLGLLFHLRAQRVVHLSGRGSFSGRVRGSLQRRGFRVVWRGAVDCESKGVRERRLLSIACANRV